MRKQEFQLIKQKLIGIARACGAEVEIKRKPFLRGQTFGVGSSYNMERRKIVISLRGNASYLQILAALAYSVRHADNHDHGRFPSYYDPTIMSKNYRDQVRRGEVVPPPVAEAVAAENDCNQFAVNFLENERHPLNPETRSYASYFEPAREYSTYSGYLHRLRRLVPGDAAAE